MVTDVFFYNGQEFFEQQKFFVHLASSVRVDDGNGMHHQKNLPEDRKNVAVLTEECVQFTNDRIEVTRGFLCTQKKLVQDEKVPGEDD